MNPDRRALLGAIFLSLLSSGILTLLAGLMLTRLHWRPDIPPYGRRTRLLDVTFHPDEYVKDAPLRAIRSLTLTGLILLATAVTVLAYELLQTIRRGFV